MTGQASTGSGRATASRSIRTSSGIAASRLRRATAAALLVLIPAGYFTVSASQSHNAAAARKLRAERAGLVHETPSAALRNVYQTPIPAGDSDVAFFEANDWEKDSLYVQFTTTPTGLTDFLSRLGTSRARLRDGLVADAVPVRRRSQVGWRFQAGHHWAAQH